MKTLSFLFAAVLLATALPDAHAQSSDGWWDWAARSDRNERYDDRPRRDRDDDRRDRDDDWDDDRYDDRDDGRYGDRDRRGDRSHRRQARGPKFCHNGQGHPVHGMRWCYEKGFVADRYDRRADRRDRRAPRWERRTVEDIIFRTSRRDRQRAVVQQDALRDILGRTRFRQLERVADGPLAGRWVYPSRTVRVLQIRDRRGPLVELTDLNGDGRVDVFLTNSLR